MKVSWRKIFITLLFPVLGGIPDARAQGWINFYPITGELSLGVDRRWQRNDSGSATNEFNTVERLSLNSGGYILDPRFFNFNVKLAPELEQKKKDSGTGKASSDSTKLNYSAGFNFLSGVQASPVSLGGNMAASTTTTDGNLGSRVDTTTESRGAILRWKNRAFPSSLDYREQSSDEVFTSGFGEPPREREDLKRTLTLEGRSSKMGWFLQAIDFDDLSSANLDYETQEARLDHTFRWGKRSELSSRLGYFNREGFSEIEKVNVNERLRLQHLENLSTTYGYGYQWLSRTTETETHTGNFGVSHLLYRNLTTTLNLSGSDTTSEAFMRKSYAAKLDFDYVKEIMPGVRLRSNLGGGYRTSETSGGRLDFSESPSVPITGIVFLTQRYIIWSTIIVTAPGCAPCLDGSDYFVEDAGGDFTQLRIPAGSRIAIGDVITVDHVYEPPTVEYYGVPYRVGVRLDFGWVAVYHNTTGENQTFVSGPDPDAVSDSRTDVSGVEFIWVRPGMRASASAERKHTISDAQNRTDYSLRQSLSYTIAQNASLSAGLSESFSRDGTDVDAYSADLSATWVPSHGLTINPYISSFRRIQDPGGTEDFLKAGVRLHWNWRRLFLDMRYDHIQRDNDGRNSVEDRMLFNVKRKF